MIVGRSRASRSLPALAILAALALVFPGLSVAVSDASHVHAAPAGDSPAAARPDSAAPKPTATHPAGPAHPGVMTQIKSGNEMIGAYLAAPKGAGPHPGIIVIQEWWGLVDWVKSVADRFAEKGYVAIAPDLYRGKSTTDPNAASDLLKALPEERAQADLAGAFAYLRSSAAVGSSPIGSIGFCMGGGLSLGLALREPKLAACVVCYGRPVTDPEKLKAIGAPILGIFGGKDGGIPLDSVEAFKKAMTTAGRSIDIQIYPDSGHGFINPNNPGHNAADANAAWTRIDPFLTKYLQPK